MKILLNGEPATLSAVQLDEALIELGFTDAAVATALNGEFVAKVSRPETALAEGDRLEVLAPMQGG